MDIIILKKHFNNLKPCKYMKKRMIIIFLIIFIVVLVIGFIYFNYIKSVSNIQKPHSEDLIGSKVANLSTTIRENGEINKTNVGLDNNQEEKLSNETCEDILILKAPVNINLVTSVLYPGQVRGGDYKPHGGFRFDNSDNKISVKIPLDGSVMSGSRYKENGVIQYMFEFKNACDVSYRFDHLLRLSSKLQEIANTLPEPIEGDSRTTFLTPIKFFVGEEIATEVGAPNNVFVDFGVYDLRKQNDASKTSELIKQYPSDLASHGVCWLDWFPNEDSITLRQLPGADSQNGKKSDYC